ncbi:MAG: succinate dehydrogenase [Pseudomonadota bacterium]
MLSFRLYMLQRLSALVMAPLVLGHIAVMIYAVQGGLSAEEILSRTQGSLLWALFYGTFVVAVSLHAALGVRVVLHESARLRGSVVTGVTWGLAAFLFLLGMQAVYSVTVVPS